MPYRLDRENFMDVVSEMEPEDRIYLEYLRDRGADARKRCAALELLVFDLPDVPDNGGCAELAVAYLFGVRTLEEAKEPVSNTFAFQAVPQSQIKNGACTPLSVREPLDLVALTASHYLQKDFIGGFSIEEGKLGSVYYHVWLILPGIGDVLNRKPRDATTLLCTTHINPNLFADRVNAKPAREVFNAAIKAPKPIINLFFKQDEG